MNKLTKAGIATAAGIALLMGGAGTLAYWNVEAGLTGDDISTGQIKFTSTAGGDWSDPDLALWVPGDTNSYSETFELLAEGDNLQVELDVAVPASVADTELDVDASFVLNGPGNVNVVLVPGDTVTLNPGSYTVEVSIDVEFPAQATGTMDTDIDLDGFKIIAAQKQ